MSLRIARIGDPREIATCIERFETFVGVHMPLEYVSRGIVYGCYGAGEQMVGGYMLVTEPPYRGVVFLPDEIKNTHWFFQTVSPHRMIEVNAVWLNPHVRLDAWEWYIFWWRIVRSIRAQGRPYVLVWYNLLNSHLHRFYGRVQKEVVYTGDAVSGGKGHTHAKICVAYTTPKRLVFTLILYLPKMLYIRVRRWRIGHRRAKLGGNNHTLSVFAGARNRE